jgi:gliding motility-associated-like protein
MKKVIFLSTLFTILSILAHAQGMVVVPSNNATALVNSLGGAGVALSNMTINCGAAGSGFFEINASPNVLGIDSGIILTSGVAGSTLTVNGANTINPQFSNAVPSNTTGNGPDADLDLLISGATKDKCILEFDFITIGDTVKFDYVFGSSEYQNWTCSQYNDVFGFFISGPGITGPFSNNATNIALVPGSTTCPVAISTIYCPNSPGCCQTTNFCFGNTPGCGAFNATNNTCNMFVCNASRAVVNYPGFTQVLTAVSPVTPCSTYHMKMAIADKTDEILDTGVFIKAGSITSKPVSLAVEAGLGASNPYILEGCDTARLKITRKIKPNTLVTPSVMQLTFAGTATYGIDYNNISTTAPFTGNGTTNITAITDTLIILDVWAPNDGVLEGLESIKIYVQSPCFNIIIDSIEINIQDSLTFTLLNIDTAICNSAQVVIRGQTDPDFTMLWSPSNGVVNPNILNTSIIPTNYGATTYTVTSNYLNCPTISRSFTIINEPIPIINLTNDDDICQGDTFDITATLLPPYAYNYTWTPGASLNNANTLTPTFVDSMTQTMILNVNTPYANCASVDSVHIIVHPFAAGNVIDTLLDCSGNPVPLWVTGGNTAGYQWYPSNLVSCEFCPNPFTTTYGQHTYNVILLDAFGCQDTLSTLIDSQPDFTMSLLNNDTTITLGESVQMNVVGTVPFISWTPPNYLSYTQSNDPVATPLQTITYYVTGVSLLNGCPITDSVTITVEDSGIYAPNAFTPNGDNRNDVFSLKGNKLDQLQEFKIFNRWGQQVFATRDKNIGWDGKYKGIIQNTDTFYYYIKVARPDGKTKTLKGEFILIR